MKPVAPKGVKQPVIGFVVVLLMSLGFVAGSWIFKEQMREKHRRNQQTFNAISQQYLTVGEDAAIIRQHYPEFLELYRSGIIGKENRLNWIDTLRAASQHIKLPKLKYTIAPQALYTPEFPVDRDRITLYHSQMTLEVDLLHEGDLVSLIDDMNTRAKGLFKISSCRFIRRHDTANGGTIGTVCEVDWLNIKINADEEKTL